MNPNNAAAILGKDFTFPHTIPGMPHALSDFNELSIHFFHTSDGVRLSYWEAGTGIPLVILPGWSASGAQFVELMWILKDTYHVYVLDPRNQGLSERTAKGMRIARLASDLRDFQNHLSLSRAVYVGWSMGASILYSFIDIYGTDQIKALALVDEPPSILSRPHWTEEMSANAAARFTSIDDLLRSFASPKADDPVVIRSRLMDSPYYANAIAFADASIPMDMDHLPLILYDHASQDWRDVIETKISIPTAIFTGEWSPNLQSQRWMHAVIPHSSLYIYTKEEQGDHFLMLKNPVQFAADLDKFLSKRNLKNFRL